MAYVKGQFDVTQNVDANGDPATSYILKFFIWDTATPTAVYSDSSGTSLGTTVTLNSLGQPQTSGGTACDIFFDTAVVYKAQLYLSDGATTVGPSIGPFYPLGLNSSQTVDSFAAAQAAAFTGINAVTTRSFYGSWSGTTAGPKGGATYHRDGTTGTASTAYADNSGFYDANGDGFRISATEKLNGCAFGLSPSSTGATNLSAWDKLVSYAETASKTFSKGACIYLEPGSYAFSGSQRLGYNVSFVCGNDVKLDHTSHSDSYAVYHGRSTAVDAASDTYSCELSGFTVYPSTTSTYGLYMQRMVSCNIKNIVVTAPVGHAAGYVGVRVGGAMYLNEFENVYSHVAGNPTGGTTGKGWWIGNGENEVLNVNAKTNHNLLIRCSGLSFGVNWHIDTARGTHLLNCNAEKSADKGIHCTGDEYTIIDDMWQEITSANGLTIDQGTYGDGAGGSGGTRDCNSLGMINCNRGIGPIVVSNSLRVTFSETRITSSLTLNATAVKTMLDDVNIEGSTFTDNGDDTAFRGHNASGDYTEYYRNGTNLVYQNTRSGNSANLSSAGEIQISAGGGNSAAFDANTSANQSRFKLRDWNGTEYRVYIGAADSGGTGYRMLRILN